MSKHKLNPKDDPISLEEFLKKVEQDKKKQQQSPKADSLLSKGLMQDKQKKREQNKQQNPSGSELLNKAIQADLGSEEEIETPRLYVVAGKLGYEEYYTGTGELKRRPLAGDRYDLPLSTNIKTICADKIVLTDVDGIEEIGSDELAFIAQEVEIEGCNDLRKLPAMPSVGHLTISFCSALTTLHSNTNVSTLDIQFSGIQFLPERLKNAQIDAENADELLYIHPAIPSRNISGMTRNSINMCKLRYLTSPYVPQSEKESYRLPTYRIALQYPEFKELPACLADTTVALRGYQSTPGQEPNLLVHPSLEARRIVGVPREDILRAQMRYLFDDNLTSNRLFGKYFDRINAQWKQCRSRTHE